MAAKTSSKSEKDRYARYKASNTFAKNKRKKLERHVKKFPGDAQAANALKTFTGEYTRNTPKNNKTWSKEAKAYAHLMRLVSAHKQKKD